MAYGGHAYGSSPYASSATPDTGVYVDAQPIVVDVALGATTGEVAVDAAPVVVDVALPAADPQVGSSVLAQPIVVDVALPLANPGAAVAITAQPIVVDVALPPATPEGGESVLAQPIVVDLAIPRPTFARTVEAQPIVVDVAIPRAPRYVSIQPWTADDAASTAFVMEVQIEVDTTYSDPTAESGWQPIRTNRVTWSSIAVDPDTGRPVTPASVTVDAEPIVVGVAIPPGEF